MRLLGIPRTKDAMKSNMARQEMPRLVHPEALADVRPLLERLERAFGARSLAQLLNVRPSNVASWMSGQQPIDAELGHRIFDLHAVLTRVLQVFAPDTAMRWLVGNEPFLGGNRPIDVLAQHGAGRLLEAIDSIEAGAYT